MTAATVRYAYNLLFNMSNSGKNRCFLCFYVLRANKNTLLHWYGRLEQVMNSLYLHWKYIIGKLSLSTFTLVKENTTYPFKKWKWCHTAKGKNFAPSRKSIRIKIKINVSEHYVCTKMPFIFSNSNISYSYQSITKF